MSQILEELFAAGLRSRIGDPDFVLAHYIRHPDRLHCALACADEGKVLGFQSLKIASSENPYSTQIGWGIIGTHVRPSAARMGAGSLLFSTTEAIACRSGLPAIEAYIDDDNRAALNFYEALGFRSYRKSEGVVCKVRWLGAGGKT